MKWKQMKEVWTLIINEEKTNEITDVKEGWIFDPNYRKIRWTFASNFSKY